MKLDTRYAVAIFGISDYERALVERILALSVSRDYVYQTVEDAQNHTAEIALVDRAEADSTGQFERFHAQRQDFPTVIIGDEKESENDYRVKRPFTATRMLGALDRLVEDRLRGANRTQPVVPASKVGSTATTPTAAAGNYKALVIDNSLPARKQVGVALRRAGITAEFAEDGESALKLIEAENYDILFLNVVLPGKDGYEVCKAIKKDKDKKHIPVVMLTGKSSSRDKLKGKLSGCDAYLTKPVSLKEFNQTLSKWLNLPPSFESVAETT